MVVVGLVGEDDMILIVFTYRKLGYIYVRTTKVSEHHSVAGLYWELHRVKRTTTTT